MSSSGLSLLHHYRLPGGASRLAALLIAHLCPASSLFALCDPGAALQDSVPVQPRPAARAGCVFLIGSLLTLSWLPGTVFALQPAEAPSLIVVETSKGSFLIETFPDAAPVSVAHFTDLVRGGFYDGLRIHRAEPGFVVQFGDPRSREVDLRELWGRGADAGSGRVVGVAELGDRLSHTVGTVGLAHMGVPAQADSQIYITLADRPELDGRYAIIGRLVAGHGVLSRLQVADVIRRMYVRD